jgi:hypothetical protein
LFISSGFTPTEAPMKFIESILASLFFDFVYGVGIDIKWLIIYFVTTGIGPTVTTVIIAETTQNPTGGK